MGAVAWGVVVGGSGDVLVLVLSRGLLVFWFIFGAANGAWGRLGGAKVD